MIAKLCATVTGATTAELRANRDSVTEADMVEVRLDYARDPDVDGVLAGRRLPVILTCRPQWEGGRFQGSEEERSRLLTRALEIGVEFVDVEWRAGFHRLIAGQGGRRVVLSTHEFDGIPEDLDHRYREMRATGAEVVKVAVRVNRLSDLVALRDFGVRNREAKQVVIGMGPAGIASRILPDRFASSWTYAGHNVVPGQVDLSRMLEEFRVRSLATDTDLFGVLGSPLAHSLSSAMHNAGFQESGRDAVYLPFEAADVDDFECFVRAFDVRGASVTAPFKEAVLDRVATTDSSGKRIGAVNTLRMDADGWHAINTDIPGFLKPLIGRIALRGCRATVLGAGGAARAIAAALAGEGATVSISARSATRAAAVAAVVDATTCEFPPRAGAWDLLVNTTPIGTYPRVAESPMTTAELGKGVVYDLVYNPPLTRLLADAAAAGCDTIGGLDMLVAQAERQFAWWTGEAPHPGTFRRAAERRLAVMHALEGARAD